MQLLKCEAFTIPAAPSPPQLAPYAPRVFGLHPASNGISRRLIEAGRQLHQGAGSLAWEQGVAGLRGIGSCLRVLACWERRSHSQCKRWEHRNPLAARRGQLGGWGSASGGEGVRLAQLRGEQACNTNQGDLVMDRRVTESPLCLLVICAMEAVGRLSLTRLVPKRGDCIHSRTYHNITHIYFQT